MELRAWLDAAIWKECKEHNRPEPNLVLTNRRASTHRVRIDTAVGQRIATVKGVRNSDQSSGMTYHRQGEIRIALGNSRTDAKAVGLHELAHWLTPSHHHDAVFYRKCFELYAKYLTADQVAAATVREKSYKPRVVNALTQTTLRMA